MQKSWLLIVLALVACRTPDLSKSTPELSEVQLPAEKPRSQYEAFGKRFMISSQGVQSTQAAAEVLKKGGNLFDAFTALSFAIGVERPHSTGLGGGGFVLFYDVKKKLVSSLDFRETAPLQANSKMFLDEKGKAVEDRSLTGGLSVAVPGHVAGVLQIQKKYGKLSLAEVLAPAIRMAEEGIHVYPALYEALSEEKERLAQFTDSKKIFLDPQGQPWPVGHLLVQKELAQTLRLIAKSGEKAFYQGRIAEQIAKTVRKNKGVLSPKDLALYRTKWREPVQGSYRGYQIYSQPPPSSGGVHVLEILNTVEADQMKKWGPQDARSVHLTASAMQKAFVDRATFMGDPDFVPVPVAKLTSKEYAAANRQQIDLEKAKSAPEMQIKEESKDTTHFSLMDSDGNAIASTQTINGYFGSAMVAEGTGIVLNNEMDDFAAIVGGSNLFGAVGGKNNLVEPGKRPLSSMSPTLVMKDGLPVLAVGTPSGTRIITCVALTILNVIEYELPLWDSVALARYHQQWHPDELQIEAPMFSEKTMSELKRRGWKITEKSPGCRIQAIQKEASGLHGVSDMREEGSSLGL